MTKNILLSFPLFVMVVVLSGCSGESQGMQTLKENAISGNTMIIEEESSVDQQASTEEDNIEETQNAESTDEILEEADALMEELDSLDY